MRTIFVLLLKVRLTKLEYIFPVAPILEHRASVKRFVSLQFHNPKGPSTLLVLVWLAIHTTSKYTDPNAPKPGEQLK
jgi:hypothetical protein